HLRAERTQVEDLLLTHLVGQDENQAIALLRRDQRETQSGVPRGRLDDRRSRLELAALLGLFDHRQADAILDRSAGIHRLELHVQLARSGIEPIDPQHRRAADHLDDVGINVHGNSAENPSSLPYARARSYDATILLTAHAECLPYIPSKRFPMRCIPRP